LPACQSCHGERLTGVAPAVPGLLGLPYDYIAAQLGSWRQHIRRAHAPDCMAQIAERLSPEDLGAVAAWLAAQPMPGDTHPAECVHCAAATRMRRPDAGRGARAHDSQNSC
jgi:cytochrome c553